MGGSPASPGTAPRPPRSRCPARSSTTATPPSSPGRFPDAAPSPPGPSTGDRAGTAGRGVHDLEPRAPEEQARRRPHQPVARQQTLPIQQGQGLEVELWPTPRHWRGEAKDRAFRSSQMRDGGAPGHTFGIASGTAPAEMAWANAAATSSRWIAVPQKFTPACFRLPSSERRPRNVKNRRSDDRGGLDGSAAKLDLIATNLPLRGF